MFATGRRRSKVNHTAQQQSPYSGGPTPVTWHDSLPFDEERGDELATLLAWDPDASCESERARLGKIYENAETCSDLWIAVIEQAIHDLAWLRRVQHKANLARHERSRLRSVLESDPVEFFTNGAFCGVCELLGIPADVVRAHYRVDELIAGVRVA
jgi:hypothetical protein